MKTLEQFVMHWAYDGEEHRRFVKVIGERDAEHAAELAQSRAEVEAQRAEVALLYDHCADRNRLAEQLGRAVELLRAAPMRLDDTGYFDRWHAAANSYLLAPPQPEPVKALFVPPNPGFVKFVGDTMVECDGYGNEPAKPPAACLYCNDEGGRPSCWKCKRVKS